MKKLNTIIAIVAFLFAGITTANAQAYTKSKYYDPSSGNLDYSHGRSGNRGFSWSDNPYEEDYYGFRIGPAFCTVTGDDARLNGSGMKTGLNIGFVYGKELTDRAPLYFETGLSYIEKGGNGKVDGKKFKYSLDYLQLPFVAKYVYSIDDDFSVQPYLGGYFALGIGGKIRDFGNRDAYSSFGSSDDQFQRFDGGLKLGCGFGYDLFYGEIGYEMGLSNICHDDFDVSSNTALTLTVGINF